MSQKDMIKTFIDYHIEMSRRVWDSIEEITEEQFLADDSYSRGSIRNLIVHLTSTDRRWLAGLKNLPDVGHLKFEDHPTQKTAREIFETVGKDLAEYVEASSEEELAQNANDIPHPRWAVLLHLINHGTDHRATILQKLHEFGAQTFNQDFIMWLWSRK